MCRNLHVLWCTAHAIAADKENWKKRTTNIAINNTPDLSDVNSALWRTESTSTMGGEVNPAALAEVGSHDSRLHLPAHAVSLLWWMLGFREDSELCLKQGTSDRWGKDNCYCFIFQGHSGIHLAFKVHGLFKQSAPLQNVYLNLRLKRTDFVMVAKGQG